MNKKTQRKKKICKRVTFNSCLNNHSQPDRFMKYKIQISRCKYKHC